MFELQLLDEVDAQADAVGFEVDEVQPTTVVGGVQLAGEIDQFRQRSTNLGAEKAGQPGPKPVWGDEGSGGDSHRQQHG